MQGRRWPYVTIGIIALNAIAFLATHSTIDRETKEMGEVREHILLLAATHPKTPMNATEQKLVENFRHSQAKTWDLLASPDHTPLDAWDVDMRTWTEPRCEEEITRLGTQLDQMQSESVLGRYAFYPSRRVPITYISANFLHGGWLHLIFNMWFLWLAGTVLEDAWGRVVYPIFFLVCGAMALAFHAGVFRGSFMPVVGASGAIAGLMGGFLARFPKTKIKLAWLFLFRFYKFSVPAYILLPLWLALQVFLGALSGADGGVAYWAHVGGFAFGALGAVLLRVSGIEKTMDQAIEAKVTWTANAPLVQATEMLGENNADAAVATLQQHVKDKPDSIDGHMMLLKAQERKSDTTGQKETLANLCRLYLSEGDPDTAWNYYEQFTTLGGKKLPRGVWLELCRYLERNQNWDRAVIEYERLAEKNSGERASVPALVAAARICLTKLNRLAGVGR